MAIARKPWRPDLSGEELLLRVIMQGTSEIDAMRAAGPPTYLSASMPLVRLPEEVGRPQGVRSIHFRRGADVIALKNNAAH